MKNADYQCHTTSLQFIYIIHVTKFNRHQSLYCRALIQVVNPFNSLFIVVNIHELVTGQCWRLQATARRKWLPQLGDEKCTTLYYRLHMFLITKNIRQ